MYPMYIVHLNVNPAEATLIIINIQQRQHPKLISARLTLDESLSRVKMPNLFQSRKSEFRCRVVLRLSRCEQSVLWSSMKLLFPRHLFAGFRSLHGRRRASPWLKRLFLPPSSPLRGLRSAFFAHGRITYELYASERNLWQARCVILRRAV